MKFLHAFGITLCEASVQERSSWENQGDRKLGTQIHHRCRSLNVKTLEALQKKEANSTSAHNNTSTVGAISSHGRSSPTAHAHTREERSRRMDCGRLETNMMKAVDGKINSPTCPPSLLMPDCSHTAYCGEGFVSIA